MKLLTSLAGGLIGAYALNWLHQTIKQNDPDAPHVDELGMEALSTGMETMGIEPPTGKKLYDWTLTSDIVANTMYYSLAGIGGSKGAPTRGTFLGLLGGLGAVYLPEQMGFNKETTNRTTRTQFETVGLYTFGGIVAGLAMRVLGINVGKTAKMTKKEVKQLAKQTKETAATAKEKAADLAKNAKGKAKDIVKEIKKKAA
ncbi:MAG: hypothetical protein EOP45_10475 [Sphingobacteriaceae bacterium]|nr:MAG: hypothetical protein EOP45_10475 [Sphingobacteriaceae bacterium]